MQFGDPDCIRTDSLLGWGSHNQFLAEQPADSATAAITDRSVTTSSDKARTEFLVYLGAW